MSTRNETWNTVLESHKESTLWDVKVKGSTLNVPLEPPSAAGKMKLDRPRLSDVCFCQLRRASSSNAQSQKFVHLML